MMFNPGFAVTNECSELANSEARLARPKGSKSHVEIFADIISTKLTISRLAYIASVLGTPVFKRLGTENESAKSNILRANGLISTTPCINGEKENVS